MSQQAAIWFPTVRAGTGTDAFTIRLVEGLQARGLRAEISWLPLRAEYAPWSVPIPAPPAWANVVHVNSWLHPRFLPRNLPVVATIHHSIHHPALTPYKGLLRAAYHRHWIAPIERRTLRRAQAIVTVSQFVADTARQTLLDLPMQVIYNGIDTKVFRPAAASRQPHQPFRLLFVGGWKALKGIDLLAPILRELGPGFELPYTGGDLGEAERRNLPSNMHNLGRLHGDQAIVQAMQDADALLFPTRSEGLPLVAIEAMACGLPVIATRGSSLIEVLEDGVSGVLCTQDDVGAFADAARCLADNLPRLTAMKQHAITRAQVLFDIERMLDHYAACYHSLLNPR